MSATLTNQQTHELVRRVEAGERISVVGIDFGLLDTEVREIVTRVRAARAARASTRPSAQPSPQPRPSASSSAPAAAASTRVSGPPAGGQDGAAASGPPPAGQGSPTGSRVGRLLTTGSPVGQTSNVPQQRPIADVSAYLEHSDKKIAKAAAAAQKAIGTLSGLVFTWEAAEQQRQEAERARTEAQRQVDELEEQLRAAREKLAAARGKKPAKKAAQSRGPHLVTAAEIRRWAVQQGMDVPTRGVLPGSVREAYLEAHPLQPDSPGADAEVDTQEAS